MDDNEAERIGLLVGVTFIVAARLAFTCDFNFSDRIRKIDTQCLEQECAYDMLHFWSENKAAPTWFQSWFPAKPAYLQLERRPMPDVTFGSFKQLTLHDAPQLAQFWRKHYGDTDWYLDADEAFAQAYLLDKDTVILGFFAADQTLIGSIAAVPFGNTTRMSHGVLFVNKSFHVVEGLCVHRDFRSKGVASWLMAAIDHAVGARQPNPFACIWSRELAVAPLFSTFLTAPTYASIPCDLPPAPTFAVTSVDLTTFNPIWERIVYRTSATQPSIVTETIDHRRGGLSVWKAVIGAFDYYVVVSNTRRKTTVGSKSIHEVVWCGTEFADGVLRLVLEAVAHQYTGLFFCTSDAHTGGAQADWVSHGWSYGTSGIHAWSIYNYIPPAFGACKILALREEV